VFCCYDRYQRFLPSRRAFIFRGRARFALRPSPPIRPILSDESRGAALATPLRPKIAVFQADNLSMPAPAGNLLHTHAEPQWSLVAHADGDALPVREFPCQIGRQPDVTARIIHPTVSLVHAEIRQQADGLVLYDLGSRNGTFVNGRRLTGPCAIHPGDLLQFGAAVFRLHHQSKQDLSVTSQSEDVGDLALALAQFDKLITEPVLVPYYQPIVTSDGGEAIAYEALARSSLFGLDKPAMMFKAAGYFQMEAELSRLLRRAGLIVSCAHRAPHLFLNTHPAELADLKRMIVSLREIRLTRPEQPMTLEVHEAAAVDISTMKMLRLVLDDLGMKLAYDDFGAGQARLQELVEARPDYLKFDRKLVAKIDSAGTHRQQMVETLVSMSRQLGIVTLAEGVETAGEAEACRRLGFQLMQGYFFGHPAAELPGQSPNTTMVGAMPILR
jgi:EAL domain-containing protein (putative c-di-GMP-specific phosphodiesterase class I)